MCKGYVIVEGQGEQKSVLNLVTRLWHDLGLHHNHHWAEPIRCIGINSRKGLSKACSLVRSKGDAEVLLILRDEDDDCPKDKAPIVAQWMIEENLPFPCGIVLFHREFETLFLAGLRDIAGKLLMDESGIVRPGLLASTKFDGDLEKVRGVKGWLSKHFPDNRSYKPTVDQLPMTRLLSFQSLRSSGLPCFGTLERVLRFLSDAETRGVYPRNRS